MKRYGMVARARSEKLEEYKKLHANAWPGILRMIRQCKIRNYSIYLKRLPDGCDYLFSYFEYVGSDYEKDMKKMAADPETQKWWAVCKPCLSPVDELPPGEVWSAAEELFHQD